MLTWKGDGVAYTNACEDLAMVVKAGKGIIELIEGMSVDVGAAM